MSVRKAATFLFTVCLVACSAGTGDRAESAADTTEAASALAPAATCAPGSVAGFSPTWIPPGHHAGACTAAQIDGYFQACLASDSTTASCNTFKNSAATCASCVAPSGAQASGPIVKHGQISEENVGGCVAIADAAHVDCAKQIQAQQECELAACEDACITSDPASFGRYLACAKQADAAGCKPFVATCFGDLNDKSQTCFNGNSFSDGFHTIAAIFCGP
jgi:hypothetical protein